MAGKVLLVVGGFILRKYQMLLKAIWKKQKESICGIFLLVFVLSLCLFSSLTLYTSGKPAVEAEMDRLGFGDFTVWVRDEREGLAEEIECLADVEKVTRQSLIYAGYKINGVHSDNEGQLLVYDGSVPYHFIPMMGKGDL